MIDNRAKAGRPDKIGPPPAPFLTGLALVAMMMPQMAAAQVEVRHDDGRILAVLEASPGQEWCLHWNHSVTGGAVGDCFAEHEGQLMLTRSYLHDFAAGLGHLPERGKMRSASEGGYWIEGMDEPVAGNALPLRVGSARVHHRLVAPDGAELDLSAIAAGTRVTLALSPDPAAP